MKLIIQIPCYNEEYALPITLGELPRVVKGFDNVEWLVVDDGSTDSTIEVAKSFGVDHIVDCNSNKGLAYAFMKGIKKSLLEGADVIVNIDADNQYNASDIEKLTDIILDRQAAYVIGERPIHDITHFTFGKKLLQKVGSYVVRKISGLEVKDAPSGFRAISRDCAIRLNVFNKYTYTLETLIQAGQDNISVKSIPIRVNKDLRPSRLVKGTINYVFLSIFTIVRIYVIYKPFAFFFAVGLTLFSVGFLIGIRFLYFYLLGDGVGHIQSVILAGIFLGIGFQTILVAFLADLLAVNRKLIEESLYRERNKTYSKQCTNDN